MRHVLNGEKASLRKADGSKIDFEAVQFSSGSVMTFETDHPIEVGDVFERQLSNGAKELHEVVEPVFYQGLGSIGDHYQCKVRRASSMASAPTVNQSDGEVFPVRKNEIFVVHGRDDRAREDMYSWLRRVGLKPMTWDAAKGLKPGAKTNFDVIHNAIEAAHGVILLFTPDESAQLRTELGDEAAKLQPRPNVLFEAGWAMGAHRQKTIIVEARMIHHVSDIDGFNNIRMRSQASLNSLANELQTLGCDVSLQDPDWMDVSKYPGLFGTPPKTAAAPQQTERTYTGLGDDSLLEIIKSNLPTKAGFFRFVELDELLSLPDGTAARLAERAARERERLEKVTADGVTLGPVRIFGRP